MLSRPERLAAAHGGEKLHEMGKKWAETFSLWGGLTAEDSILDIGCGPGRMANAIGERFEWRTPFYSGFDIKKGDIDYCKTAFQSRPNFKFQLINLFNDRYNPTGKDTAATVSFPSPGESVSFCFATSIFTHFFKDEVIRYLAEAHRCLKPGGRFFSTWFLIEPSAPQSDLPPRYTFEHSNDDGTRSELLEQKRKAIAFNKDEAIQFLQDAGFTDLEYHRGAWRRDQRDARHAQDTIVAMRP